MRRRARSLVMLTVCSWSPQPLPRHRRKRQCRASPEPGLARRTGARAATSCVQFRVSLAHHDCRSAHARQSACRAYPSAFVYRQRARSVRRVTRQGTRTEVSGHRHGRPHRGLPDRFADVPWRRAYGGLLRTGRPRGRASLARLQTPFLRAGRLRDGFGAGAGRERDGSGTGRKHTWTNAPLVRTAPFTSARYCNDDSFAEPDTTVRSG